MFYVIWTARLAVAGYLTAIGLSLGGKSRTTVQLVWTAGFTLFCLHVLTSFHFIHHWSHTAARSHTAEQTREIIGWDWGGGIWFNYLFLGLWGLDVLFGWFRLGGRTNAVKWFTYLPFVIHLYLVFIVLNATVIFGPSWWRPLMAVVGLLLIGLARRGRRMTNISPDDNP